MLRCRGAEVLSGCRGSAEVVVQSIVQVQQLFRGARFINKGGAEQVQVV